MAQMKKPMTPAMKTKIKEMFPKVTKAEAAKQALINVKKTAAKTPAKPATKTTPTPKTTTKAPAKAKMTPQDAAMKKILEKKYGKIYG